MIKVSNEVTIYEVDGQEHTAVSPAVIVVRSHWNRDSLVVLEVAGKRVAVAAADLQAAVVNATNTRRFP